MQFRLENTSQPESLSSDTTVAARLLAHSGSSGRDPRCSEKLRMVAVPEANRLPVHRRRTLDAVVS
jgi:hypothetical protein